MLHISRALEFFNGNPRLMETLFRSVLESMPELNTTSANFDLNNVKLISTNYGHESCTASYDNVKDVYTVVLDKCYVKDIRGSARVHYANLPLIGHVSRTGQFRIDSLNMRIVIRIKLNRRFDVSDANVRFEQVPEFRAKITNTGFGRLFERLLSRIVENHKTVIVNQVARSIEARLCDAGPLLRQYLK